MQVFRHLLTFSVVPTNLGMFSSLGAQLEVALRIFCLCIQLCWKSRTEDTASPVVPAHLDTKASLWHGSQHAKTTGLFSSYQNSCVSEITTWKSTFLKYCRELH